MATLAELLRVLGPDPPRRAVLTPDGKVRDKTEAGGAEIDVLSAVCAIARRAAGLRVFPLRTLDLFGACVASNDPGAWKALHDDIKTGDIDWGVAAPELLASVAAAVACLVAPRDAAHMVHMSSCLTDIAQRSSAEARAAFGQCLGGQLAALAETLMRHSAIMRRDVRDAVLSSMGRLVASCDVPAANLVSTLLSVLSRKQDELLRLFLHVPLAACVQLQPDLAARVLQRVRVAQPGLRYPPLAMLARLASSVSFAGLEADLVDALSSTLAYQLANPAGVDARTALVSAVLVQTAGDAAAPLVQMLARALQHMSASLIEKSKN